MDTPSVRRWPERSPRFDLISDINIVNVLASAGARIAPLRTRDAKQTRVGTSCRRSHQSSRRDRVYETVYEHATDMLHCERIVVSVVHMLGRVAGSTSTVAIDVLMLWETRRSKRFANTDPRLHDCGVRLAIPLRRTSHQDLRPTSLAFLLAPPTVCLCE